MAFGGIIRQSTSVDVLIGPFLDDTDGKTDEGGLTIEDEHILLSKNGQAMAAKNDANNAVHDAGGYYNCPLNTTDTDTVGQLTIALHMVGALPVRLDFQVMDTVPYDEMLKDAAVGMQGVIEVNNLDHLLKVTTGVAADGDLSSHVVDQTVMSHLLTATADTDKFKASTDSLEAIKVHADTVKAETALIVADTGTNGVVLKAAGLAADAIDEILDEEVDNDGTAISLRGAIKLILSILTAKASGGGTATLTFRDINDAKDRLVCTVDANGNRTAVGTRDAS